MYNNCSSYSNCNRIAPTSSVWGSGSTIVCMLEETKKRLTNEYILNIKNPHDVYHSIMNTDWSKSCGNIQVQSPQILEPNEAYACVIKRNKAYERISVSQTIALNPNEAYESVTNNPVILYEEIV